MKRQYIILLLIYTLYIITGCSYSKAEDTFINQEIEDTEDIVKTVQPVEKVVYEQEVDDMISEQDTEDTGMSNPYFPYKGHTSLNGYAQYYDKYGEFIEETVDVEIIKAKEYEEGNIYKLTIYIIAEVNPWYFKEDDFLSIYFYVTDDKIYRMYPYCQLEPGGTSVSFYNDDALLATVFDTEEKLQSRGVFMPVCQEEDMQEEFYSIKQVGNKITYHYFEIDINKDRGYKVLFVWEKGKGLVEFETGWGAGMMSSVHVDEICEMTKNE